MDLPNNFTNYSFGAFENETLEQLLLRTRGPKHLPLQVVIPITVVYVLIFVTGVIGNVAVCLVIVRNSSMHTATNYYLFNLAVSDLTLLILGLPNDLSVYWQQYPWLFGVAVCKIRALVSEMASYISILTILAFSMERYLAICHPLHSYTMAGLRRAIRIITALWIVALVAASPFALYTDVDYVVYPPGSGHIVDESAFCAMLESNMPTSWPIYEFSFLLFFLIPMIIIIVLYMQIGLKIRKRNRSSLSDKIEGTVHRESKNSQSKKSIIRMLSAVVITFFLCWAPFHTQRLMYVYASNTSYYPELNEWMYYITGGFYYFSSTVNPILYNLMSIKYRNAFKQTLCGLKPHSRSTHRYGDRFSREGQSSFRDTIVEVGNDSPQWSKRSTRNRQNNAADVVVMIAPNTENCFTSMGKQWPRTTFRVTMSPHNIGQTQNATENNHANGNQGRTNLHNFFCNIPNADYVPVAKE